MTDYAIEEDHVTPVSDPAWRILTGAAAFGAGVFVCGSVGSYVPTDPSWNSATDAVVQNLFGGLGAVFADVSRQMLGWSGWIAGLALMIGGAMRAVLIGYPRIRRWLMGALCIPLSAAFFAAWPVPESWPLSTGLGGMKGDVLFHYISMPFEALLFPSPNTWAGAVAGLAAGWAALSALGFRRDDARLLKAAATRSGRKAAHHATGAGGLLKALFLRFKPKPKPVEDDPERTRVIKQMKILAMLRIIPRMSSMPKRTNCSTRWMNTRMRTPMMTWRRSASPRSNGRSSRFPSQSLLPRLHGHAK